MIESIKRIGLFMIVAQTVIHFAAGRQYEKYMRIIAGIVVLLLFITPFSSYQGNAAEKWRKELEQITEKMESYGNLWPEEMAGQDYGAERKVMQQLEAEMKRKLMDEAKLDGYEITDIVIAWGEEEEKKDAEKSDAEIRITLGQTAVGGEGPADRETADSAVTKNPVYIERIQIGGQPGTDEQESESTGRLQEYRSIFAEILGIEEERVEVIYDGRR